MNKGRITTTRPIPLEVIRQVRENLKDHPRNYCFWVLMTNVGLRVGDLLKLKLENVRWNGELAELEWRATKTGKVHRVPLNALASDALKRWLAVRPGVTDYVIEGERGQQRSPYYAQLIKRWCAEVGYEEPRTANHSLRKAWVKTHLERGTRLAVLQEILGHATEGCTLKYAGVLAREVEAVYAAEI